MKLTFLFFLFYPIFGNRPLEFNEDNEFIILQFSDLHFGANEADDINTVSYMKKLIDLINPNLVAVTGDAISGEQYKKKNRPSEFFQKNWRRFTNVFSEKQQPYFYVLGNHDSLGDITNRQEIMKLDMTNPYSLSQYSTGISGASNYHIEVYPHGDNSRPAMLLWAFDTGILGCGGQIWGYGCIEKDQISWYSRQAEELEKLYGKTFQMAFFHIPVVELVDLLNSEYYGTFPEHKVECPIVDTGAFEKFLQFGDIKNLFFGHLHSDDVGGWVQGIEMAAALSTRLGSGRFIKIKKSVVDGIQKFVVQHYEMDIDGNIYNNKTLHTGPKMPSCPIPPYQYELVKEQEAEERSKSERKIFKAISILGAIIVSSFVYLLFRKIKKRRINSSDVERANLKANIDAD